MTKQLTSCKLFRKCSAVDRYEWLMTSFAPFMYFLRNGLFTTSAFSVNDNTVIGRSHQFNLLQYLPEWCAVAKYILTTYGDIRLLGAVLLFLLILTIYGRNGGGCRNV